MDLIPNIALKIAESGGISFLSISLIRSYAARGGVLTSFARITIQREYVTASKGIDLERISTRIVSAVVIRLLRMSIRMGMLYTLALTLLRVFALRKHFNT